MSKKNNSKSVIITGAAGFIGSHLTDKLLSLGYNVIGMDNFVRGNRTNLQQALDHPSFQLCEVDLSDYNALQKAYRQLVVNKGLEIATIWHLAANSNICGGVNDPSVDLRDTFMTTFNILRVMELYSAKQIVFSSTSAVYGVLDDQIAEDAGPLFPISNYGAMKLSSEANISAFLEKCLDKAWICRFPNVVGSRATHGVIYDFFHKLRKNPSILRVLGDGSQCKPYLHINDLIEAMIYIWQNSKEKLNYFNIGQLGSATTVKYIAEQVAKKVGGSVQIIYGEENRGWIGDVPKFAYNTDKLRKLGWSPSLDSNTSVDKAIDEIYSQFL